MKGCKTVALIFLIVALFSACGGGGSDNTEATDTTAPMVSSTSPASGATGVAINSSIAVTFSEAMGSSTINGTTFTLSSGSGSVSGTVTCNGSMATFTPSSNLSYNTTYTATITTGAKDAAGNAVASNYTWNFMTGNASDTTPPTVSSTKPANNATEVAVNSAITATFSETMDASSVTTSTFYLGGVVGTVTYSGSTATFTPSSNLSYNTTYTATITTGAKDAAGNAVASNYTWSFTTGVAVDTTPPTAPTNLVATAISSSEIQLSWSASTDNVAVSGYKIYRDGNYLNFTASTSANNTGLTSETQYCYAILAVDSSGNESAQTAQVCATTPQTPWQTSVNNPNAIVKDNSGNFYVAGANSSGGSASLEKFDNTGIKKWHVDIDSAEYIAGIASDGSNVYVYWVDKNFNIDSDKAKAYVSAYDTNANNLWGTEVISSYAFPDSIAANANNIYISASNNGGGDGNVVKKLDFSGNIIGQVGNTVSDFSNITIYNGYVYCVGHNANSSGGYINLVKYDADLNQIWQTTDYIIWQDTSDTSQNYDMPNSIVVDVTGIYLGGYIWTPADNISYRFLAVHYDDDGNRNWVKIDTAGINGAQDGIAVAIDDDNIYTTISSDYFNKTNILKLKKSDGSEVWQSQDTMTLQQGSMIWTESSVIQDGILFIPDSSNKKIVRFNASTGAQIQ